MSASSSPGVRTRSRADRPDTAARRLPEEADQQAPGGTVQALVAVVRREQAALVLPAPVQVRAARVLAPAAPVAAAGPDQARCPRPAEQSRNLVRHPTARVLAVAPGGSAAWAARGPTGTGADPDPRPSRPGRIRRFLAAAPGQAGAAPARVRAAPVPTPVAEPSPGGQDPGASPAGHPEAPGSGSAPCLAPHRGRRCRKVPQAATQRAGRPVAAAGRAGEHPPARGRLPTWAQSRSPVRPRLRRPVPGRLAWRSVVPGRLVQSWQSHRRGRPTSSV